jgi:hypothetical protein
MGVNEEKLDVHICNASKFFTRMVLCDKISGLKWNLLNVYCASKYKDKGEFLAKFVQVLGCSSYPFFLVATSISFEKLWKGTSLRD